MKCPYCMEEIADNSETCNLCNSKIIKPCPFCLEKIQADAIKCKHCNSMLNGAVPQQPGQPPLQQQPPVYNQQPYATAAQPKLKSQTTATILCALLGGLGIHRFYLGPIWAGVVYLLFCWSGIPGLIAVVETFIFAFSSQESWARKHNNGVITAPVHIVVKILVAILPVIAIVGILAAIAIPQFSAYRTKGYNAAAKSDLLNAKTSLESYFADHQKYPKTLETAKFKPTADVTINCSILQDSYVCGAAHKQGNRLYVADNAEAKLTELPYKAGAAVRLPYDPQPTGSAKADVDNQNQAPAGAIQPNAQQQSNEQMTFTPSFDCKKASTGPERLICSNKELAQADVLLAQAYRGALGKASNKADLKREQSLWIKNQRDACSDANAMLEVYQERIAQLSR